MKRFLAMLCVFAVVLGILSPISTFAAGQTESAPRETDIAVMSWNMLNTPGVIANFEEYYTYNARVERAVEIISRYDADSIGFQETNPNIRNALNVMLTDYAMVPGMELSTDTIFYRKDRVEVVDSGLIWLSETPDVPSTYALADEERIATWAVLKNKETGASYIHFNTHLALTAEGRDYGMRVLRQKIEDIRLEYPGLGIVATGDFNMDRTSDTYKIMVSQWPNVDMQDTLYCAPVENVVNEGSSSVGSNLVIASNQTSYDKGMPIDHIFASIDQLDVVSYRVMRDGDKDNPSIAASDHFGIYVELNVGQGSIKRVPGESRLTAAYGTATMDGTLDETYALSHGGTMCDYNVYNDVLDAEDLTVADYYFLYDDNYLYYYIDVKDAAVTPDESHTHTDNSDSIEIYYNFAKATSKPTSYSEANGEAGFYRVYSDGYDVTTSYISADVKNKINEYVAVKTDKGYAIEGKIPLTDGIYTILNSGAEAEIGMGLLLSDDADNGADGKRDYLVKSHSSVLTCWSNPASTMSVYLLPNENGLKVSSYGDVKVDGKKDASYDASSVGTIEVYKFYSDGTAVPEIDQTSAKWWTAHDADYLYYFIDVKDAHVTDADKLAADYTCVDSIEIYYSFDRATSYSSTDDESGYFTVYANGTDFKSNKIEDAATVAAIRDYVALHTDTGYVIEGKIPLTTTVKNKLNGDDKVEIGLSFLMADDTDNGEGVQDYLLLNHKDVLFAWGNPSKTSSLYLMPTPEKYAMAPYGAVKLDGVMDEAYSTATAGEVNKCGSVKYPDLVELPDDEKTSLEYYVAHDRNYLYLYLDVTDYHVTPSDVTCFTDSNGAYGVDSIEVYYNFAKGTTNPISYSDANGEAGYFVVFANGKDFVNKNLKDSVAAEIQNSYVAVQTDTGYVIELRIPLTETARSLLNSGNLTAGVAFLVNDDADYGDTAGGRDYVIYHATESSSSLYTWGNPSATNDVVLAKNLISGEIATTGEVTVDGIKDTAYHLSTTGNIDNVYRRYNDILEEGQETTATYNFARDDEYLYYFIDVTDYAVTDPDKTSADCSYDGTVGIDCVGVYFNYAKATTNPSSWGDATGEAGYFDVFANGEPMNPSHISDEDVARMTYVAVHTEKGYVIEGRIPLSATLKEMLSTGEDVQIGIGFMINDDANNGEAANVGGTTYVRDYLILNNSDILTGWSYPSSINTLIWLEGDATLPGSGEDEDQTPEEPEKTEFTVTLPNIEGLTITTDKETYQAGETVILDIQLDDGYEFVQDDGRYDHGHWSTSRGQWVYFCSTTHGLYTSGRTLKADQKALIWSGNTFVMPDHDVEVIAEVERRETAVASQNTVILDGVKDDAYANSSTIPVNRSNKSATYYDSNNPAQAYGYVNATYDGQYLYCFAQVFDDTKTTMDALTKDVEAGTDLSLVGFDSITFYFDFLNTDTENTASNQYPFVDGESGLFLIDSLALEAASSGAAYNKLGAGFASYNGNSNLADYVVVQTEEGYNVELKIALSDSLKAKIEAASEEDQVEIGFGAMIVDDTHNNGGWDYENGDTLTCSTSLVSNLWAATTFARNAQGDLQLECYASPRWMSKMVLKYGEDVDDSDTLGEGYTASISTTETVACVGDTVKVNVKVASKDYEDYASAELKIVYDSTKLTFDETNSLLNGATVMQENGTLTLEDYGENQSLGIGYTLAFTAAADGETTVTLESAAFSTQAYAEQNDLIPATIASASASVKIIQAHRVELPDIFKGEAYAEEGSDYTFYMADDAKNYEYGEITATMGGETVEVIDNSDGSYTIKNVTGDLVISGTRTGKKFTVTINGSGKDDVTASTEAQYGVDYVFALPDSKEYTYELTSIRYADGTNVAYTRNGVNVKILGTNITGSFTITIDKKAVSAATATVTFEGNAASDASGSSVATPGVAYSFTVSKNANYDYDVTATVNEKSVTLTENDNGYTIAADAFKGGDVIVITVNKAVSTRNVTVSEYVTVDNAQIWLVKVTTEKLDGSLYTYKDNSMFWSEKYGAYCWLIVSENAKPSVVAEDLAIVTGFATEVDYSMDINMSGRVDANDAQLTYNMYNAHYNDFTEDVTIEKFLRADVTGDGIITMQDAAAVINYILNG